MKNETQTKDKRFDYKQFFKGLLLNNIMYKGAAIFLGFLLWLFLGYMNSGM